MSLSYNSVENESFSGRFITEKAYDENEKQFMDKIQSDFFNICNASVDDFLTIFYGLKDIPLIEKMRFHGLINKASLRHRIKDILNKIAHSELRCGDDITIFLSGIIDTEFFQNANPDYILFFEYRAVVIF